MPERIVQQEIIRENVLVRNQELMTVLQAEHAVTLLQTIARAEAILPEAIAQVEVIHQEAEVILQVETLLPEAIAQAEVIHQEATILSSRSSSSSRSSYSPSRSSSSRSSSSRSSGSIRRN